MIPYDWYDTSSEVFPPFRSIWSICWFKQWYPQIILFSGIFPYKPSILGIPHCHGNHDLESPPWCFTDDDIPWRLGHGAAELLQPLAQLRSLELVAEGALAAQRLPTAASSGAPAAAFLKKHGDTVTRRGTISLLMKMIQRIQSTNGC